MNSLKIYNGDAFAPEFLKFIEDNYDEYAIFMANYRCAAMNVETRFRTLNEQFSSSRHYNPIETIKTRMKSEESMCRKIVLRNVPFTFDDIARNITDIAGVRVICSFEKDIYRLADFLLNQDDIVLIEKKDYIANPKPNGYRSLHLIVQVPIFYRGVKHMVNVEVQLRTIAMDFWASLEHKLRYKKNLPQEELPELSEGLLSCAALSASLDEEMQILCDRILDKNWDRQDTE